MYSSIWLSKWSAANVTSTHERDIYLGVYGALGAGQGKPCVFYSLEFIN